MIDNQTIPGAEISTISISPVTGNIFINTTTGYIVTPDDGEPPAPDAVAITTFSASPLSIIKGKSTALSWTTKNATGCSLSSNVPNLVLPGVGTSSAGLNVTINVTGNYAFTLNCIDASNGQDTKFVNITVTSQPTTSNACSDYVSPLGGGVIMDWADFWGVSFPGPESTSELTDVPRRSYLALEFNTGELF